MSDRTLVVHAASLAEVQDAVTAAHDQLVEQVQSLLRTADATMAAWSPETASRAAETQHRQRLTDGVQRLAEALDGIRAAAADFAEEAHQAEVRNVALLD